MTPAEKQRQIAYSYARFMRDNAPDFFSECDPYDVWLLTEEGKRLTAEELVVAEHEDSTIDVLTEIARSLVQMSDHQLDMKKQLDRMEGNMKL